MDRFVLRVALPDRPGALGLVASRVGAVRGEIVGIEILERVDGRALDEVVVDLPDSSLLELLVAEVTAVDGVDVDDLRRVAPDRPTTRLGALEAAAALAEAISVEALVERLVAFVGLAFEADASVAAVVPAPTGPGDDGSVRVPLASADRQLVLRRHERRFTGGELAQLAALGRIAGSRWRELTGGAASGGRNASGFGVDRAAP